MATAAAERAGNLDSSTNCWHLFAFDYESQARKHESGLFFHQGDGQAAASQGSDLLTTAGVRVVVRDGNHKVVVQAAYSSVEGAANNGAQTLGFTSAARAEADEKHMCRWFVD
jgi:hypothetical protein